MSKASFAIAFSFISQFSALCQVDLRIGDDETYKQPNAIFVEPLERFVFEKTLRA